jgi:hypothetical protein
MQYLVRCWGGSLDGHTLNQNMKKFFSIKGEEYLLFSDRYGHYNYGEENFLHSFYAWQARNGYGYFCFPKVGESWEAYRDRVPLKYASYCNLHQVV